MEDILGGSGSFEGPNAGIALAVLSPSGSVGVVGQVNSEPLGSLTGAPPWARLERIQVIPYTAVGAAGRQATVLAPAQRQNRVIVCTAPAVGFAVYVGDSGVRPGFAFQLPPGLAYDVIIPGGQILYAVTDAPSYLPVQVQNAALLTGGTERRA